MEKIKRAGEHEGQIHIQRRHENADGTRRITRGRAPSRPYHDDTWVGSTITDLEGFRKGTWNMAPRANQR